MPGYKGHIAGGVIAYGAAVYLLQGQVPLEPVSLSIGLLCAVAGSLFPDIDIRSRGRRLFFKVYPLFFVAIAVMQTYYLIIPTVIMGLLPFCVKHRGLYHKSWFVVGLSLLLAWTATLVMPTKSDVFILDAFFFSVGALSHIWLDLGWRGLIRL